jgi:FMN phosphatase YigB (HAD superfamily)
MIKAVLMDIGGPINDETEQERMFDDAALDAVRQFREVSAEEYVDICKKVVDSFAPRAYRAILWELAQRDAERFEALCRFVRARAFERFHLRPEIPAILDVLAKRYKLGIVANSSRAVLESMQEAGILDYFSSRRTAEMVEMYKPNMKYFELVLDDLEVLESEAVMVGDRVDCDVVPARMMGMKAVRFRVGRHTDQEPRMPSEVPDAEITSMSELPNVLMQWDKTA